MYFGCITTVLIKTLIVTLPSPKPIKINNISKFQTRPAGRLPLALARGRGALAPVQLHLSLQLISRSLHSSPLLSSLIYCTLPGSSRAVFDKHFLIESYLHLFTVFTFRCLLPQLQQRSLPLLCPQVPPRLLLLRGPVS